MHASPRVLVAAIILFVLLSLANLASLALPSGEDGIPIEVLYLGVALGIIGLLSAWGLWRGHRWALVISVLVLLISIFSAAPGLFFAPSTELQLAAAAGVVASVLNLVLLLVPPSRRFFF